MKKPGTKPGLLEGRHFSALLYEQLHHLCLTSVLVVLNCAVSKQPVFCVVLRAGELQQCAVLQYTHNTTGHARAEEQQHTTHAKTAQHETLPATEHIHINGPSCCEAQ